MTPQKYFPTRRYFNVPHIEVQALAGEPTELHLYPDFVIGELLKRGLGKIEADKSLQHDGKVDFVFTADDGGSTEVICGLGIGMFRSALARFGPRCNCNDMLYGGHTLFSCDDPFGGTIKTYRLSLYVCNLQHCGFWLRLYLYQIDDNPRPVFEPIQ